MLTAAGHIARSLRLLLKAQVSSYHRRGIDRWVCSPVMQRSPRCETDSVPSPQNCQPHIANADAPPVVKIGRPTPDFTRRVRGLL